MKLSVQVLTWLVLALTPIVNAETSAQPDNAEPAYYWFDGPNSRALLGPFGEWYGFFEQKTYPTGDSPDPDLWRTDVFCGPVHFRLPLSAPMSALVVFGAVGVVGVALAVWLTAARKATSDEASNA
jgi:hypothetical protein